MTDNDKDMQLVEDYILKLKWSDETPDIYKTLVAGNIRTFHAWYVETLQTAQQSVQSDGAKCACTEPQISTLVNPGFCIICKLPRR